MSAPGWRMTTGNSLSRTTASASIRATSRSFSIYSSAFTARIAIPARALGLQSARKSWSATTAESGCSRKRAGDRPSISRSPPEGTMEVDMAGNPAGKPLEILLVEDNPADVDMTRQALELGGVAHSLYVTEDGEQALRFRLREAPYADAPEPDVVLLDLKLPKASGYGLLAAIRAHRRLKNLTVIILTSSNLQDDEQRSHEYA